MAVFFARFFTVRRCKGQPAMLSGKNKNLGLFVHSQ
jgi:hypothetical protein